MFEKSQWIWADIPQRMNQFVRFTTEFIAPKKINSVKFYIAAETKYYLYLNNRLLVFDGGLHRESTGGNGYYDEVELSLAPGNNTLSIDVWYWGNGGRNNTAFPFAGVLFACDELNLYSGKHIECGVIPAYY